MWRTTTLLLFVCLEVAMARPRVDSDSDERVSRAKELRRQGDFAAAEKELIQAIREAPEGLKQARALDAACGFYYDSGKYVEAESCLRKGLSSWQKLLGENDVAINRLINRLACVYIETGQKHKAERLKLNVWLDRLAEIDRYSRDYLNMLGTAAALEVIRGNFELAETLNRRAIDILEHRREMQTSEGAVVLNNVGMANLHLGRYDRAHDYLTRAVAVADRLPDAERLHLASSLSNLAALYLQTTRYVEAESSVQQAIEVVEKRSGLACPRAALLFNQYAAILRAQHKKTEARDLERRAKTIFDSTVLNTFSGHTVDIEELKAAGRR